jgi:hypothetical protein
MAPKMAITGVGPRIALAIVPYAGAVVAAAMLWPGLGRMQCSRPAATAIAATLGTLFVFLYTASALALFTQFKSGRLIAHRGNPG